jgi:hypothetical protein
MSMHLKYISTGPQNSDVHYLSSDVKVVVLILFVDLEKLLKETVQVSSHVDLIGCVTSILLSETEACADL